MSNKANRDSWNKLSNYYQSSNRISLNDIHYAPYGPGEKSLKVVGDVKNLEILDMGCGGGQNSIVLKKWGAKKVVALDQSDEQLNYAKNLAKENKMNIHFVQGNMEDLSIFIAANFDLVFTSHDITYVTDMKKVFFEVFRVLKSKGRFVMCTLHPMMSVIWDAVEKDSFDKINNYFEKKREFWSWNNKEGKKISSFGSTYPKFETILNGLIEAGFKIEKIVEPKGFTLEQVKDLGNKVPYRDETMINEKFIEINQKIPFSLIISSLKE
ncbi:MAG: putative methyltransferase YcgJ [Candidatus Heimdallarchaeota archaeon LC_3]|nr:MAG: putative methyltransferase YcgJ [Candidatus Heimdallarchaeota archaeon LC_3]